MKIPTQIMAYNVYNILNNSENKLIGKGEEMTLPKIAFKALECALAGGTMEIPSMQTDNIELEVPFNCVDEEMASCISLDKVTTLKIRAAKQKVNSNSHDFDYSGIVITAKGFSKEVDLGKLVDADKMDSKITLNLSYFKIASATSNDPFVEIDKLNGTLKINGKDVRAGIDKYL